MLENEPGVAARRWGNAISWAAAMAMVAAGSSCTGVSFQPRASERTGAYRGLYGVTFEVGCDSCSVEWGREGDTHRRVVKGDWHTYFSLGTVRTGQLVHVLLRADPLGETLVEGASIEVDGRTVAAGKGKKPGDVVFLSARVGPG